MRKHTKLEVISSVIHVLNSFVNEEVMDKEICADRLVIDLKTGDAWFQTDIIGESDDGEE